MEALCTGNAGKGKNKITFQLEKMQRQQKELKRVCAEAERNGKLTVDVAQEVEEALYGIQHIEEHAFSPLDNLDDEESSQRVETTQRPRTRFPTYEGLADRWIQF